MEALLKTILVKLENMATKDEIANRMTKEDIASLATQKHTAWLRKHSASIDQHEVEIACLKKAR
jgi:hypothetical protein